MEQEQPPIFREVQRVPRRVWLLVIAAALLEFYLIRAVAIASACAIRRGISTDEWVQAAIVIVPVLLMIGFFLLAPLVRQITEVRSDGLFVRLVPFHRRPVRIPLERVTMVEARSYRPILDYGGWGIRWTRRGKAYNLRGNRGVRLDLNDGRHIMIGSQQAERLEQAIIHRLQEPRTK